FRRLFGQRRKAAAPLNGDSDRGLQLIDRWRHAADMHDDAVQRATYCALVKVVSALYARHGQLWGSRDFVASIVVDVACNQAAGDAIGQLIDPLIARAV